MLAATRNSQWLLPGSRRCQEGRPYAPALTARVAPPCVIGRPARLLATRVRPPSPGVYPVADSSTYDNQPLGRGAARADSDRCWRAMRSPEVQPAVQQLGVAEGDEMVVGDGQGRPQPCHLAHHAAQLARGGLAAVFVSLHRDMAWRGRELVLQELPDEGRELGGEGLVLVPSAFSWPTACVLTDPAYSPMLVYPCRGVAALWAQRMPAPDALSRLLGLGRGRPDGAGQPGQYDAAVGGPAAQPKHRLGTPHSAARSRAPAPSAQRSSGPLRTYLTRRRAGRSRCLRWLRGRRLGGAIGVPRDAAWYSVSGADVPGRGAGDRLPPGRGSEPRWVVVVGRVPLPDALRRGRRSDPG